MEKSEELYLQTSKLETQSLKLENLKLATNKIDPSDFNESAPTITQNLQASSIHTTPKTSLDNNFEEFKRIHNIRNFEMSSSSESEGYFTCESGSENETLHPSTTQFSGRSKMMQSTPNLMNPITRNKSRYLSPDLILPKRKTNSKLTKSFGPAMGHPCITLPNIKLKSTKSNYQCTCKKLKDSIYCVQVTNWLDCIKVTKGKQIVIKNIEQLFEKYTEGQSKFNDQIKKDVCRTFPKCPLFSSKYHGKKQLEKTLQVISKYDPTVGYVQGMNYIVATLLYHTHSEPIAFWFFIRLLEDYNIRDILYNNLSGLHKHLGIMNGLFECFCPDAFYHMKYGIDITSFATDWVMSLFTKTIPLATSFHFLEAFLSEGGWIYFYKLVIQLFKKLTPQILKNNFTNYIIKIQCTPKIFNLKSDTSMDSMWRKLIQKAKLVKINEQYINYLQGKYDYENLRFKIKIDPSKFHGVFTQELRKKSVSFNVLSSYHCNCKKIKEIIYCSQVLHWLNGIKLTKGKQLIPRNTEQLFAKYSVGDSKYEKEIKADVCEIFPECPLFSSKYQGKEQLEKTLQVISKYDPTIGYIQGMDYITATLLYHTHSEPIAFWFFIRLLEDYHIRDTFFNNYSGLYKHLGILNGLFECFCPEAFTHMKKYGIEISTFAKEWVLNLFTKTIPLAISFRFIENFLANGGWIYLYKLVIQILKKRTPQILKNDFSSFIIKIERNNSKFSIMSERVNEQRMWEKLMRKAKVLILNEQYIDQLLGKYDYENKKFLIDIDPNKFTGPYNQEKKKV